MPPVPVHHTATTDAAWDGPEQVSRITTGADKATLSDVFAWIPAGDSPTKSGSKGPHHLVGVDGAPGKASTKACSAAIGALNGARGGMDIPDSDREATWRHLAAHLKDAGVDEADIPELQPAAARDVEPLTAEPDETLSVEPAEDPIPVAATVDTTEPVVLAADAGAVGTAPMAAAAPVNPADMRRFHIPIGVVEGARTSDKRGIKPEATFWRDPPLPLMATDKAPHGNLPTTDAQHVGTINVLSRRDVSGEPDRVKGGIYPIGSYAVYGSGEFDLDNPVAADYARRVYTNQLNTVSADMIAHAVEVEVTEVDDDGYPMAVDETMTNVELLGFTIVPHPAFAGCFIVGDDGTGNPMAHPGDTLGVEPDGDEPPPAIAASAAPWIIHETPFGERRCLPCESGALTASAAPLRPPVAWFADPELAELTPPTITEDGRYFGHLAGWGTCHTGISGQCVTPPRGGGSYGFYRVGATLTAEGELVATGVVITGTGHASTSGRIRMADVMAHYDDTGSGAADVVTGEDAHGIWFSGALRPDVSDEQIRVLRGSALSGDWRMVGGRLHLVAALAVNTPGFPIPRAIAASGAPVALVAAGAPEMARLVRERNAALDPAVADMLREYREALAVQEQVVTTAAATVAAAAARAEQVALRMEARQLREYIHKVAA